MEASSKAVGGLMYNNKGIALGIDGPQRKRPERASYQ